MTSASTAPRCSDRCGHRVACVAVRSVAASASHSPWLIASRRLTPSCTTPVSRCGQVRFISHVLDKHAAVLSKLPEFAVLSRDLRAFVAANARTWEHRDERASSTATGGGAAAGGTAAAAGGGGVQLVGSVSNADTTASGLRDVAGKC